MRPGADVDHSAAAERANVDAVAGELCAAFAVILGLGGPLGFGKGQRGAYPGELLDAARVGEKAEVANAAEALGQDMQEKAAHELVGVQRHRLGLVLAAMILPPKADAAIAAIEKTAVGDGDAMRVAAEIVEDLRGAGKRAFGKDDPGVFESGSRYSAKADRSLSPASSPTKAMRPESNAARNRPRNRRRKQRESTWTGRKKLGLLAIQLPSGPRPPPGTMQ